MKLSPLFVLLLALLIAPVNAAELRVAKVEVRGEINQGTYLTLQHAYDFALRERFDVLFVVLDTPGGLLSSTQKIVKMFLNSEVPVVVFVPRGAMCASAGSIILLSSHIAVMADGTAVGAATPVSVGFASAEVENKTVNYIAGYVKDIARERGRNEGVAEKFVTQALTLTAKEALEQGIIDYIANTEGEAIEGLKGRSAEIDGKLVTFEFDTYRVIEVKKPLQASIYEIISSPQLAAILLLLGIYLLIFGLTSPGLVPETVGAICLILALAGLGVIGINHLGLLLIVLGVIFLFAELMTPTYGVLGAASVVSVVLGLLILFNEPLMPESFYDAFPKFVAGMGVGLGGIMTFMIIKIAQIRKKKSSVGEVVGEKGEVLEFYNGRGFARVRGEIWKVVSDEELEKGDEVEVIAREGLTLRVRKIGGGGTEKGDAEVAGEN
ncbi:MAG: Nodulation protein NfeD (NfeD) [Archaeoglobus fulgidus]|uniref:Nodulation protein NfeD (NfeD) n=1 Tax=Archaeoglobus fulgidus TaxID=2234 RepID=A0A101E1S2_ARCFL|nr:nodulation protein NfeD [Archaeoglobus fulgidus]KUJ93308.1 MAG: Nodulation protein NfeD (NfeD) [Archaeoglobus fulgidus]KUK06979.1 MAG: Nodulation protein NfeD (NfeD) [Archaeoglobus fulgidus]